MFSLVTSFFTISSGGWPGGGGLDSVVCFALS